MATLIQLPRRLSCRMNKQYAKGSNAAMCSLHVKCNNTGQHSTVVCSGIRSTTDSCLHRKVEPNRVVGPGKLSPGLVWNLVRRGNWPHFCENTTSSAIFTVIINFFLQSNAAVGFGKHV